MKQKLSVLIIEDHPLTSCAYKMAFNNISNSSTKLDFKITIVEDCDSASSELQKIIHNGASIDIVLLDINLKPSKDGSLLSGEDLGIRIRRLLSTAKIMVSTLHFDNYRIQSIISNIDPEGFLVKNDFNTEELIYGIKKVIENPPYYSSTVLQSLRQKNSNAHTLLDNIDRKLLFELSIGTKMKDMPGILPLSMSGIEKRKRNLKEAFAVKMRSDKDLVLIAKEKGFI